MIRKVIMTRYKEWIMTSLTEDGDVVEIRLDDAVFETNQIALGEIYIGKVKKILPNINAAFLDIGKGMDCYYDLNQKVTPMYTHKSGNTKMCIGDELIVQVSKEAMKMKAPSVSGKIELAGQYFVLTSGNSKIGVSGKLSDEQKTHYRGLMKSYRNDQYGFIVRTNAANVSDEVLQMELDSLITEYEKLRTTGNTRKCFSCLKSARAPYLTGLLGFYQNGLEEYLVEDKALYKELSEYMKSYMPLQLEKLHLYTDDNYPLEKRFSLQKALEEALSKKVWLKNGGFLILEPTEALTVIDVNSGKMGTKKKGNSSILKANLEAAKEIARQIRLRNYSGIILIDFINMDQDDERDELIATFSDYIAKDPIKTNYVDTTALQLVELTRKKIRKPLFETLIAKQ